jgi:hypothetical protein
MVLLVCNGHGTYISPLVTVKSESTFYFKNIRKLPTTHAATKKPELHISLPII